MISDTMNRKRCSKLLNRSRDKKCGPTWGTERTMRTNVSEELETLFGKVLESVLFVSTTNVAC